MSITEIDMPSTQLKRVHDQMLADRPEDAVHDEAACPFCVMDALEAGGDPDDAQGGRAVSDKTYSQADLEAAIAKAVADATAPLQSRLEEIDSKAAQEAREAELAAAREEADAKVAEIQAQLDTAVAEKAAAEGELTSVKEYLDAEAASKAEAEAISARKEERLAKVKETAAFPDDYLEKNADRFAAMSDEDFDARIEEWASIARPADGSKPKVTTAMTAAREDAGGSDNNGSALGVLRDLRGRTSDPRTL